MKWLAVILVFACPALADDMMGTWNVTSKPSGLNTCRSSLDNNVYQWLVAVNGTTVEVTVVGQTSFPQLVGTLKGKELTLTGRSAEAKQVGGGLNTPNYFWSSSVFRLSVQGARLVGSRFYVGWTDKNVACLSEFEVVATKQ